MSGQKTFISGNEAVAYGAIAAGCRFFGGYPISPSSEIAENMAALLPPVGGIFVQMEDEIASLAAVIGASASGKKAMTATSGPGFSLMQEHIGYACFAEIPFVLVNIQRGGPSTGLPTYPSQQDMMQARWGTHGDHAIVAICPSSVTEMYSLTIRAFNLSERFRVPVFVMADEVVGHMREALDFSAYDIPLLERVKPSAPPEQYLPYKPDPETLVPPMAVFGEGYRHYMTGLTHGERGFWDSNPEHVQALLERLMNKIYEFTGEIEQHDRHHMDDAEYAVVAYGSSARTALRAVRDARAEGLKVGMIRLVTVWPFPDGLIDDVAKKVKAIVVPEMNLGQIVLEVERCAHGRAAVELVGVANGEIVKPHQVLAAIHKVAGS
jgi:2-oxoglutarate ferredoxin oxidoreductase subunit alpha